MTSGTENPRPSFPHPASASLAGENLERLFSQAPFGIFQAAEDKLVMANEALARRFGHQQAADMMAAGGAFATFFAPPARWGELMREAEQAGAYIRRETDFIRPDGSRFTAWLRLRVIPEPAGQPGLFEGFLEPGEESGPAPGPPDQFHQLAENLHKVFWLWDAEHTRVLYVSPAYERLWGRSCQSLRDQPESFAESIHPEDRARVLAGMRQAGSGAGYEDEYRIVRPDGSIRWVHDRGFMMRDDQGEWRLARLARDITDRCLLADQLRQAQKMEAVAQLAGGVAHNFNNILSATFMHLGSLQENPHVTPAMKESLRELEQETQRAAVLTRQLLAFGRRQVAVMGTHNLNTLLHELLPLLRLLGENIELSLPPAGEPCWTRGDAGMLEQMVITLCINAREAMPRGGALTLRTSPAEFGPGNPVAHPDGRAGRFVCLEVSDTGHGMAPEVAGKIFEPFFTTKETARGTGLGLAAVYGMVKQHSGWIEVESMVGQGTTIRVYVPATEPPAEPASPAPRREDIRGGSETILFVEDELVVRRLAALALRKLGYAVLEADNAEEALKVWVAQHSRIELLLTDMAMPGRISGLDLARRLQGEKPGLRVIICSGHSNELAATGLTGGAGDVDFSFLPKPFRGPVLARAVRRCLDIG